MIFSKVIKFDKEAYNTKFTPKGITPHRLADAKENQEAIKRAVKYIKEDANYEN